MPCKAVTAFAKQTNKPFLKHTKLGMSVLKLPQKVRSPYKTVSYSAAGDRIFHIQLYPMCEDGTLEFLPAIEPWNRKGDSSASNRIMLSSHFLRPRIAL